MDRDFPRIFVGVALRGHPRVEIRRGGHEARKKRVTRKSHPQVFEQVAASLLQLHCR